ncbi:MAG TPA: Rrf2 family transcriptional regulator [Candidatus Limnocylindrales bacterium]|nr:Rrf2 family transcriptional regulator [Candidatus Limnocylindrales bacterium]
MRLELTRRADYAVRASLALARSTAGLRSGRALADETAIPPRFVAQVMGDLVAAGLVEARTGRAGGYRLARSPDAITILAVVEAVEGDARRRTCVLRAMPCSRDGVCEVHEVFSRAQDALLEQLAGASLASVVGGSMGGPSGRPDT